jgi:hypothetical protein
MYNMLKIIQRQFVLDSSELVIQFIVQYNLDDERITHGMSIHFKEFRLAARELTELLIRGRKEIIGSSDQYRYH